MSPVVLVPLGGLVHIKPVVDKQFLAELQVLQCLYCWNFAIARMLNSYKVLSCGDQKVLSSDLDMNPFTIRVEAVVHLVSQSGRVVECGLVLGGNITRCGGLPLTSGEISSTSPVSLLSLSHSR